MNKIIACLLLAMLLLTGCKQAQPEETTETTKATGSLSDILQDYADTLTTANSEAP